MQKSLSFGNVFIIGQVSVQNHPKVLNRVRSGTSSLRIKVRLGMTSPDSICLLPNTIKAGTHEGACSHTMLPEQSSILCTNGF